MDSVVIRQLTIQALIGVYQFERHEPQRLILDLDIQTDLSDAAQSDDVSDTVDYGKVCEDIKQLAADCKYQLLESLSGDIIAHILQNYRCQGVSLTMYKPDIMPDGTNVAVKMTRTQQQLDTLLPQQREKQGR